MRRRHQVGRVPGGFRLWIESQGLAKGTVRNYVYAVSTWQQWCDENDVSVYDPKRDDLRAYLGDLLASHARSNVELMKIGLRRFFTYLIEDGRYTGDNPVTNLTIKKQETEPAEPFTKDELTRMYLACRNHQERAVYLLLVAGGLRRGEVFGIVRNDVDVERGTIRVLGKGHQYRLIAPGPAVIQAVLEAMQFNDRLCPQADIEVVWRIVKALAKRAGIRGRIFPHRFRHSFAVLFLENGGSIDELQMLLGHRRLDQSAYYARATAKRRALEAQAKVDVAGRMLGDLLGIQPAQKLLA